jgi:hypothetical protein
MDVLIENPLVGQLLGVKAHLWTINTFDSYTWLGRSNISLYFLPICASRLLSWIISRFWGKIRLRLGNNIVRVPFLFCALTQRTRNIVATIKNGHVKG